MLSIRILNLLKNYQSSDSKTWMQGSTLQFLLNFFLIWTRLVVNFNVFNVGLPATIFALYNIKHISIIKEWLNRILRLKGVAMYGGCTEGVVLWTIFLDSFETYKTFLRRIITEFERKVDVQNHEFGVTFPESIFFIIK